jgi:hypothetical protein
MDRPPDASQDARPEITTLLLALRAGHRDAMDGLLPLVYAELRRIAHRQLAAGECVTRRRPRPSSR